MDKKQFIARFKHIYSNTKRGPNDSPYKQLLDVFLNEVIAKSSNDWNENTAQEVMTFVEHTFKYQPEATQMAKSISSEAAEIMLAGFLQDRGYVYSHIPESREQSPDGYIEGFDSKYVCELKSPVLIFDHDQAPFGYKHGTTHSKILNAIHDGKKQLKKLDPDHSLPHILIYTSAHPQLDHTDFRNAVRGYIAMQDGSIVTDLRSRIVYQNTKRIIEDIDMYIWLQIGGGEFHQAAYFYNAHSKHTDLIQKLVSNLETKTPRNGGGLMSIQSLLSSRL